MVTGGNFEIRFILDNLVAFIHEALINNYV